MNHDIKVDVYQRNNRHGVQITHLPSNITVVCDSRNSQIKNRDVCLKLINGLRRMQERD